MPGEIGVTRRLATGLSWPFGVLWTSWAYIWRTTEMRRRETDGSLAEDMPPPIPPGVSQERLNRPEDGTGPLLHRTYSGAIRDATLDAAELIARVSADPNIVAPQAMARFRKIHGSESRMQPGDEFLVHMPGPWDGPVRAVEVAPTSFRFATLAGHLEAGQIEWRASERDGRLVFEIESWARSGDRLSAVLHDRLLMAKEVQLHMWTSVIERVARTVEGRLDGGLSIVTRRVAGDAFTTSGDEGG